MLEHWDSEERREKDAFHSSEDLWRTESCAHFRFCWILRAFFFPISGSLQTKENQNYRIQPSASAFSPLFALFLCSPNQHMLPSVIYTSRPTLTPPHPSFVCLPSPPTCDHRLASQTGPAAAGRLCACTAWCCKTRRCSRCRHCPQCPGTCWSYLEPDTRIEGEAWWRWPMGCARAASAAASFGRMKLWLEAGAAAAAPEFACWRRFGADAAGPWRGKTLLLRISWTRLWGWKKRKPARSLSLGVARPAWAPVHQADVTNVSTHKKNIPMKCVLRILQWMQP